MPELPDITVYIESLSQRIDGRVLEGVRIASPFLLRTADPPIESAEKRRVVQFRRLGKRIAIGLEDDLWLVLHLMIAGRLRWKARGTKLSGKSALAAFDFAEGTLLVTEAGTKKRASLHVVQGKADLATHDPGGLDVMSAGLDEFAVVLTRRNHTLKRALTDPTLFSGIGNAYSDEILHRAALSPVAFTQRLGREEMTRLHLAIQSTLAEWTDRLRTQTGGRFPDKVTAFRPEMAVHGKYGEPCPACGTRVQRIRYADNETNYCPRCQTAGKILADRALSRLLKSDWPRSIEELESPPHGD